MRETTHVVIARIIHTINVPHHICDHIFNKKHKPVHRFTAGGILAFTGVIVSKIHVDVQLLQLLFEYVGYFMHGLGLVPVVDHVVSSNSKNNDNGQE